jgi:hypothetical protein
MDEKGRRGDVGTLNIQLSVKLVNNLIHYDNEEDLEWLRHKILPNLILYSDEIGDSISEEVIVIGGSVSIEHDGGYIRLR